MLIKILTNITGEKLFFREKSGQLNLLDIGCSNFIPGHFCKYDKHINYVGCDPDPVGLSKTESFLNKKNFINKRLLNIGASDKTEDGFLIIPKKRTGSKVVKEKGRGTKEIKLVKTSELQHLFPENNANIIKIDCEGNEIKVINGTNLENNSLLCLEIECTLNNKGSNNIGELINNLEKKDFFIASIRYHNAQTISDNTIKNKLLLKIYTILGLLGFMKIFDRWTNLSGALDFDLNKSFLYQLEIIFLKRKASVPQEFLKKYYNCLIIYGFLRYIPNLNKLPLILRLIIKVFPSR